MINSKILVSIAIVLIIGVAAAGYQISQTPDLWQVTDLNNPDPVQQDADVSVTTGDADGSSGSSSGSSGGSSSGSSGGSNVMSASQARSIAQNNYILEDGAVAGNPTLTTMAGRPVYVVPVMVGSNRVGEIHIDAVTGKNVGGAGF
ncbi:MAG: PepSY domain-containing protein [Euryarchaeota archaeon]|nr:PepSY domain-containing protein [Euryarchaeota archaeon]MBV1730393.1 PepSY domain-containing protein [Methanobacterium sp.]MBU4548214.1 PepSY domain-containing protein [Euryarchaeota archaeon]MBU4608747.1 PepSY domain-containing protein [Euryarchaeota archaeon]MBV1755403.1 PepSY domain-containing protein [Methanobacterium sp.]